MLQFKYLSLILASTALSVFAHPGHDHTPLSEVELVRRKEAAKARHLQARNCAKEIAAFNEERKAKREFKMGKRQASGTTTSLAPSATAILDNTCITAPEVTEGPYYINNEWVRQDLREIQGGIDLYLDIGVVDTSTCQPLSNAFVELWHANATGYYAGFGTGTSMKKRQGPGGGGGGGGSGTLTSDETFLRGGWPTNSKGLVEILTVYPGFYTGRTAHIHVMVHTNYQIASNGTLISHAGSLVHIGQIFFDESDNDDVYATSVYAANHNSRTLNSADSIFAQESANGNDAIADITFKNANDPTKGAYGYITIGVNSKASYSITTNNYNTGYPDA